MPAQLSLSSGRPLQNLRLHPGLWSSDPGGHVSALCLQERGAVLCFFFDSVSLLLLQGSGLDRRAE